MGYVRQGRCGAGERCETANVGWARLGANGRWAAFINPTALFRPYGMRRVNLQTNAYDDWPYYLPGIYDSISRMIADDGTITSGAQEPGLAVPPPASPPTRSPPPGT